ncbi:Putative F-box domain-containing protein [Septoria linicola]|uniref:F-box domain-containing protein n=1 Tax=Septoria linicola TaxID=215465 RepID=A0A9Q9ASD8_9PEZI|nr:Putative F-box domain-containing protein [Septoria linicola]
MGAVPTEIVEIILCFLSMPDLLRAQTVCTLWRDLIARNERLQQALFFVPQKTSRSAQYSYDGLGVGNSGEAQNTTHSIIQATAGDTNDRTHFTTKRDNGMWTWGWRYAVVRFNPLLIERGQESAKSNIWDAVHTGRAYLAITSGAQLEASSEDASWRRMLLSQPPVSEVSYEWRFGSAKRRRSPPFSDVFYKDRPTSNHYTRYGTVHNPAGIRMGEIFDEIAEHAAQLGVSVDWKDQGDLTAFDAIDPTPDEEQELLDHGGKRPEDAD